MPDRDRHDIETGSHGLLTGLVAVGASSCA